MLEESVEAGMEDTPAFRPSGGQFLTALGTAIGQDPATANGLHAGAKSMPALADQLRRLIGALHEYSPKPLAETLDDGLDGRFRSCMSAGAP
jgi:hypothetical protein